jgi:succinate dehydrogenase / fumarate reductase flavoprotein subunit
VKSFCYQDSPRRAHSIAAQGGINAAKNYKGDGDSVYRLFYDTIKGGDYRSRESNVYRLAEVSRNIIDQCVAQGVPFAREYGGLLDNRSFGGVQVSRTFYARGQTGQQLLIGAYQALERQVAAGTVKTYTRHEMVELIVVDGRARGIIVRDLVTGEIETYFADVVVLASGGYGNVFFLSTNAMGCNVTATWRAHRKGAYMANPCYTQIHPTCIPVSGHHQSKLTLMSESLRNDGRIWVPKDAKDADKTRGTSPRRTATTTSSGSTRRSATWSPATSPPARPRTCATRAAASARRSRAYAAASTSTSPRPSSGSAAGDRGEVRQPLRHVRPDHGRGPLRGADADLPRGPLRDGRLWVDYDLQSTIPGLFVTGEANFSDHGANRLGASALMQGPGRRLLRAARTRSATTSPTARSTGPGGPPAVVEAQQSVRAGSSTS